MTKVSKENKNAIDDIHKKLLPILENFINYCKKNNLTYYMIGGTFLGSIRHKGFIPWDDDIDIAMPRQDYEKLLKYYKDKKYSILHYSLDKEYKYYISKVVDKSYKVVEKSGNETYLFIDIFPIDGMPNNKILKKIHCLRILYHRMKLSFYYNSTIDMEKKRRIYEKILIFFAKKTNISKLINPIREKKKIDKLLMKYSFENSKYSGTIMGAYREREIVPTYYFGKPTHYKFENYMVCGPELYDKYLTHMYGNYMQIPDKKDQHIHIKEIIKTNNN